jgi:hypothetical protein
MIERILCAAVLLGLIPGCAPQPATSGETPATAEGVDPEALEKLRALGYIGHADPLPPDAKIGTLSWDRERAAAGVNLITNSHFCSTQLIGMDAELYRTWSVPSCHRWGNAVLTPQGDLIVEGRDEYEEDNPVASFEAHYLMRFGWDGTVLWKKQIPAHHDVDLTPDGKILTLTYRHELVPSIDERVLVRENYLVLLTPDGDVLEEVSLRELLEGRPDAFSMAAVKRRMFEGQDELDILHANSVEWMRRPELAARSEIYGPHNVLVCIRNQDTLAILDWKARKLVWAWGRGEISGPHDATLLPGGNILAFDNGLGREWSRVIEVDPLSREIVWEYRAPEPKSFYSGTRGANQRLANGNTLITESDAGRVFEVTPDGTIVWEFMNPNVTEGREPSVVVRTRRFEGYEYAEIERSVESGEGLPVRVD